MEREREAETMEERLCYAAMKGDLTSLQEIIEMDDSILDRVVVGIFKGKNPLHVAISTGQTQFVLKLLNIKPGLAEVFEPELGAPLHIASAKGHLEIVRALMNVSPKMCLARDGDGNSPLHIAAMNGHDDVLAVLLVSTSNSFVAQAKVDRGDTILHLCVKYDQLKCLEKLLDMVPDPYFVNDVDANGNTILHLAVFERRSESTWDMPKLKGGNKQIRSDYFVNDVDANGNTILHLAVVERRSEIIKHVLSNQKRDQKIAVNALNKSGRSALDILLQFPSGSKSDDEIKDILHQAGAKRFKRQKHVGDDHLESSWKTKRRHTFMIVFSLIATMAYQVGVNPPGGVWIDDADDHKVGKAIVAYNYPDLYPIFMCLNTAGFLLSLTTILVLILSLPARGLWGLTCAQSFISWCMFLTTAFSYIFCVIAISPDGEKYVYDRDASAAIKFIAFVWGALMSLILVLNLLHLTIGICELQRRVTKTKCMNNLFGHQKAGRARPSIPNSVSENGPKI